MSEPFSRSCSSGSRRSSSITATLRAPALAPVRPAGRHCGRRSGRAPRPRRAVPGWPAGRGSRPRPSRSIPGPRWPAPRSVRPTRTGGSAARRRTAMVANIKPSTRSSRPPWPGMRSPESFTPNLRFNIDSHRSPAIVARPPASPIRAAPASDRCIEAASVGRRSRHAHRRCHGARQAAEESRPGLVGRETRPKFGPFQGVADDEGDRCRPPR